VPEMKAWFAKYFGSGSKQDLVPLSHDYLTQQLQAADDNVWGGNTLQDFLDSSLTEKKEKLQEMIVAGEDSLANDDGIYTQGEVNIYKKLVQQLSGQPTQQQMGPSIGQQLKKIVNDYTGTLTVSNEVADAYDAKSPADLQNVIVNIKDAYPAIADQLQQAFEQHISGAASAPAPAGSTYDPVAALAEWKTIFPNAKFPDKFNNPEDAKAWVYKNLNNPNASILKKPQIQAFWDKWFGSGATAAPSASGYAPAASTFFKPSLDELQSVLHDLPGNFAGIIPDLDKMTPQEFKENYEFVKGQMAAGGWDYDPDAYPVNAAWTKIVKYIDSKSAPSGEDKPAPPPPPLILVPVLDPIFFFDLSPHLPAPAVWIDRICTL
jgi:flagellar hook-basal body complex protein FliE